jgi:hypothetical protein
MMERRLAARERRERGRVPFVAAVAIGPERQLAQARNLGEHGMELVRAPGPLPQAPIHLAFELPDGGAMVVARGAVVFERADGSGRWHATGVRFIALSARDRARIARFVDARAA